MSQRGWAPRPPIEQPRRTGKKCCYGHKSGSQYVAVLFSLQLIFQIKWEVYFSKDLCLLVFIALLCFYMHMCYVALQHVSTCICVMWLCNMFLHAYVLCGSTTCFYMHMYYVAMQHVSTCGNTTCMYRYESVNISVWVHVGIGYIYLCTYIDVCIWYYQKVNYSSLVWFSLVGWVIWHINLCKLFNAKSIFM